MYILGGKNLWSKAWKILKMYHVSLQDLSEKVKALLNMWSAAILHLTNDAFLSSAGLGSYCASNSCHASELSVQNSVTHSHGYIWTDGRKIKARNSQSAAMLPESRMERSDTSQTSNNLIWCSKYFKESPAYLFKSNCAKPKCFLFRLTRSNQNPDVFHLRVTAQDYSSINLMIILW